MSRGNRFVDLLYDRGIEELLHFTQLSNLGSILEHGLAPRASLDQAGLPYDFTDPWRLDEQLDTISLSVSCFNWEMFRAVRDRLPGRDWVILSIDAMILPGSSCRFYPRNAASGEYARSMKSYRSIYAFEDMFEDRSPYAGYRGPSYRGDSGLADNMTTDPQAEILFEGVITHADFLGAWVENEDVAKEVDRYFTDELGHEIHVIHGPIAPRHANRWTSWG